MASGTLDAYEVVQHLTTLHGCDLSADLHLADVSESLQALIQHACEALRHLRYSDEPAKGLETVFRSLSDHCLALLSHGGNATSRALSAHKHAAVSDVLWLGSYSQLHAGWRPAGICKILNVLLLACHARHGMQYVVQEHLMVAIGMLLRGDEQLLEVILLCLMLAAIGHLFAHRRLPKNTQCRRSVTR